MIGTELRRRPPDRAIWGLDKLTPFPARAPRVNDCAARLFDYFVALGGTPLVSALRSAVEQRCTAGGGLKFYPPEVTQQGHIGAWAVVGGLAWSGSGCIFFPNPVIVPVATHAHEGPLVWPIGLALAAPGVAAFFVRPGVIEIFRRQQWLARLVSFIRMRVSIALTGRN